MKWYWLTLIIVAVLVVGFFVGKAVQKSQYAKNGGMNGDVKPKGMVSVETNADGTKKLSVAA